MPGSNLRLIIAAISMTVGVGIASADIVQKKPRPQARKDWSATGAGFFSLRNWRFGTRNKPVERSTVSKPQFYTYRSDPLVALGDRNLEQPRNSLQPMFAAEGPAGYDPTPAEIRPTKLDNSLAQLIFETLQTEDSDVRVTQEQNAAVVAFYKARGFLPAWTNREGIEASARPVIGYMAKADVEGLRAESYRIPVVEQFSGNFDDIETDLAALAKFDVELTAVALRYATNASGGQIKPNRLSGYHDLKPPLVAPAKALEMLTSGDSKPEAYLASLHPTHHAYRAFKKELIRYGVGQDVEAERLPLITAGGGMIRQGETDKRIPLVRARLVKLGYLKDEPPVGERAAVPASDSETPVFAAEGDTVAAAPDPLLYTDDLAEAVKKFQSKSGLQPDAIVGPATIRAMNNRGGTRNIRRLVLNMERMRWMPRELGKRHVFVNQPAFEARVIDRNREIWKTRVIVGKPKHQTSIFSDEMETVVFNPYWGVPQSILANEMLPQLQANPYYLDQRGFEVYNVRGRKVSSSSVDWYQYGGRVPFEVRQPPGASNALGRIKFLFPNKHSIYMHDTPKRSLFSRDYRAFSHGCVRVKNPDQFAQVLLGWSAAQVKSKVDAGKNARIELKRKIPVHIAYFTAWPDQNGTIRYLDDIYGRDKRLELAFGSSQIAMR